MICLNEQNKEEIIGQKQKSNIHMIKMRICRLFFDCALAKSASTWRKNEKSKNNSASKTII